MRLKQCHFWRRWAALRSIITVAIVAGGCTPNGIKATSFGNLSLLGANPCKSASISLPWPEGVIIRGSDGTQVDERMVEYEIVRQKFGEPKSTYTDERQARRYVTCGKAELSISFENEQFRSLNAYGGATLVNTKNGKEVTLPAEEAMIREVFGRPTKVEYLTKPSP